MPIMMLYGISLVGDTSSIYAEMGWMPLSPNGIAMCQACDIETQE